ncbi:MAG: transcriptional repressor [Candidatus Hydrogenedentes bacterium]|nr:transcriptional repressor [Candidatus Hydrogenedentota bacterium]
MPTAPEPDFAGQLRAAGVRVTRPRLAVLSLLHTIGGHRSADDIVDALRERGPLLPRASIYNVLNDLFDRGVIMRVDAGPGRALYEASTNWHHHFVCRQCGYIMDVPCAVGSKPCMQPEMEGLAVDEAQVIFRGGCPFAAIPASDALGHPPACCMKP